MEVEGVLWSERRCVVIVLETKSLRGEGFKTKGICCENERKEKKGEINRWIKKKKRTRREE